MQRNFADIVSSHFCEHVVPLLDAAVKLNSEIRRIDAMFMRKGSLSSKTIPTIAEHLIEKLVLPSGNGVNHWPDPKTANAAAIENAPPNVEKSEAALLALSR